MAFRKTHRWEEDSRAWQVYAERGGAAARVRSEDALAHAHGFSAMVEHEVGRSFLFAFGYLIAKLSAGRRHLSILDYGGGLGLYFNVARQASSCPITYTVQELPDIAALGATLRPEINFVTDPGAAPYDLAVAIGALHYLEDWRGALGRLAQSAPLVFVNRGMMLKSAPDFIMAQTLPNDAGQVCSWCWNEDAFLQTARELGLELLEEFWFQETFSPIEGAEETPCLRGYLFASSRASVS